MAEPALEEWVRPASNDDSRAAVAPDGHGNRAADFGVRDDPADLFRMLLREVEAAAALLEKDWGVAADVWSAPSFTELRREGLAADRWNMLHPEGKQRISFVEKSLKERPAGPVVAASDYLKAFADQIRPFVPKDRVYRVLGTDGFGRSDSRAKLRHFFEVNRIFVTIAALKALADQGEGKAKAVADALKKYGIDPDKADPTTV